MVGDDMEQGTPTPEESPLVDFTGEEEPAVPAGMAAVFGPFIWAITAPAKCWEALDARPALSVWIVLWVAIFSTVLGIINLPITLAATTAVQRATIQARGIELSAEQIQRQAELTATFITWFAYLATPIFMFLLVAISALLVWVCAAIMGGRGATFGRSFAVAGAASTVRPLLYSVYATIILQLNPPQVRRPEDMVQLQPTLGLDLLVPPSAELPIWLITVLKRVDLFAIWWVVLVTGGAVAVLKLKKGQAITLGVVLWFLGTLWAIGAALLATLGTG